jgi:hypothetical protein
VTAPATGRGSIAKQVIAMRKDLGMRKGKMIAQGAHASLKVLIDAGKRDPSGLGFTIPLDPALSAWLGGRFTKVCVAVGSEARDLGDWCETPVDDTSTPSESSAAQPGAKCARPEGSAQP